MDVRVNIYGLKLLFISAILFSFLFFMKIMGIHIISNTGFLYISILDILVAAFSFLFLEDIDPIGYYLSWAWVMISNIILFSILNKAHSISAYTILAKLFFAIFYGTLFLIVRYSAGKLISKDSLMQTVDSEYEKEYGKWDIYMSVGYVILIFLDILYYSRNGLYFLRPEVFLLIISIAYILSFFNLYFTETLAFNLSVFFILVISLLPFFGYIQISSISDFLISFSVLAFSSFIVFFLFYEETEGGGVASSKVTDMISIVIILVIFVIVNLYFRLFPFNNDIILLILLPITIGSILSDVYHGIRSKNTFYQTHKREDYVSGSVGGLGMADGLWFYPLLLLIVYILLSKVP